MDGYTEISEEEVVGKDFGKLVCVKHLNCMDDGIFIEYENYAVKAIGGSSSGYGVLNYAFYKKEEKDVISNG